jgi:hypothetical protein
MMPGVDTGNRRRKRLELPDFAAMIGFPVKYIHILSKVVMNMEYIKPPLKPPMVKAYVYEQTLEARKNTDEYRQVVAYNPSMELRQIELLLSAYTRRSVLNIDMQDGKLYMTGLDPNMIDKSMDIVLMKCGEDIRGPHTVLITDGKGGTLSKYDVLKVVKEPFWCYWSTHNDLESAKTVAGLPRWLIT